MRGLRQSIHDEFGVWVFAHVYFAAMMTAIGSYLAAGIFILALLPLVGIRAQVRAEQRQFGGPTPTESATTEEPRNTAKGISRARNEAPLEAPSPESIEVEG
jgi:hypothetical protein